MRFYQKKESAKKVQRREGDLNSRGIATRGFQGHRLSGLDYLGSGPYDISRSGKNRLCVAGRGAGPIIR